MSSGQGEAVGAGRAIVAAMVLALMFVAGQVRAALIKRNGRWLFKRRVISSDGGLDPKSIFYKTYKPR
jgi:hypothetical protein